MLSRVKRIKKRSAYLLLLLLVFSICVVIGALYSRFFDLHLSLKGVSLHFSPVPDREMISYLKCFLFSFYDDAFDALYIFVAGFMLWGKAIVCSLLAIRGIRMGYYAIALANAHLIDNSLFTPLEYFLFLLVEFFLAFLIICLSREALFFNDRIKECYPKRFSIVKKPVFRGFAFDTVIICGIIAVSKILYTFFIILL